MDGSTDLQPIAADQQFDMREFLLDAINALANGSLPGDGVPPGRDYGCGWQWFDPAQVTEPEDLPEPWAAVYAMHNEPMRHDCVQMGYRYVHSPVPLRGYYPRCARAGVFCISLPGPTPDNVRASDLIWIGDELGEDGTP